MQPGFNNYQQTHLVQSPPHNMANVMSAPSSLNDANLSSTFPQVGPTPNHTAPFWLSSASSPNGNQHQQQSSQLMSTDSNSNRNDSFGRFLTSSTHQSHFSQNSQQPSSALPNNISRQSDALGLDTIAVALHELEQLSLNKRSLSVNAADLEQNRIVFSSSSSSTFALNSQFSVPSYNMRCPSSETKPAKAALGHRRSCEPPFSPQVSSTSMRPPPAPFTAPTLFGGSMVTSSPISAASYGFQAQSPPGSFFSSSTAANPQQRRSTLSNSVPGSLDSYQIETETVDSGLGNDSTFFLLPTTSVLNTNYNPGHSGSSHGLQPSSSATSSNALRHSAYQSHSHRQQGHQHQSRRPRASSTAAAGPSSRRHLFYCRHHLQARQKPYHFPASCVAALRNDCLFNVSTGLPPAANSHSSSGVLFLRHSCSISSQSRSITPGSSPTRSSEADSILPMTSLMRSRSLDDVHRGLTASSANSLSSRPGHASANQSDLGQWDHGEPDDELTITGGSGTGWGMSGVGVQPSMFTTPQPQQQPPPTQQRPLFSIQDWPHSSMLQ